MNTATTREQLLEHAELLMRQRGCNGFSYRDLAERVGVKTASIHYYFPAKDDLLTEVMDKYTVHVRAVLQGIDPSLPANEKLATYASLFRNAPTDKICLGGMLASNVASLSDRARESVLAFFRLHEKWLSHVVAEGMKDGTLTFSGDPEADGRWLFAMLQGAIISARLFQDPQRLCDVVAAVQCRARATH
ncbi:TetR/AcrR family transcriptional regulator [Bordetella tumulicola]|uniref:TetR/AcrR family transcriptional regulator n=1 Tax=Bordetella tumulicola TaxID=1649133 RepID=UPI0039F07F63